MVHPQEHPCAEPWGHLAPDLTKTRSLLLVWRSMNKTGMLGIGGFGVRAHLKGSSCPKTPVNDDGREL